MSKEDNGGPAFPISFTASRDCMGFEGEQVKAWNTSTYRGISVRDYFAAKAMQGLLTHPNCMFVPEQAILIANEAYIMADAMLEARKK